MTSIEQSQQRMAALEEANWIRFSRAQLKRNLRSGEVELADLIRHPPEYIMKMTLYKLLIASPGIAQPKARQIMGFISPYTTVGGMTLRQRAEIVTRLPQRRYDG